MRLETLPGGAGRLSSCRLESRLAECQRLFGTSTIFGSAAESSGIGASAACERLAEAGRTGIRMARLLLAAESTGAWPPGPAEAGL